MRALGAQHGFDVHVAETVLDAGGRRIGATAIRQALAAGDLDTARAALGRPYGLSGRVIHGNRLGRELGYPTANIAVRWRPAVKGIFAVRVSGAGLNNIPACQPGPAADRGRRAAGAGSAPVRSCRRPVRPAPAGDFIAHLRDEAHFDSLPALVAQMDIDARRARQILAGRPPQPRPERRYE